MKRFSILFAASLFASLVFAGDSSQLGGPPAVAPRIVTEGTACPGPGLQGMDNTGLILSCQSGLWKGVSARLGTDTYQTGVGPGGGWNPMDCPPGYIMTGMTAPMEDYKYIRCKKLQ